MGARSLTWSSQAGRAVDVGPRVGVDVERPQLCRAERVELRADCVSERHCRAPARSRPGAPPSSRRINSSTPGGWSRAICEAIVNARTTPSPAARRLDRLDRFCVRLSIRRCSATRRASHQGTPLNFRRGAESSYDAAMSDYDVAIVGASIAGCTAATLLGRQGARVALVESHADPDLYKRMCTHAFQASASRTFHRLGMLEALERAGAPRERLNIWSRYGWICPSRAYRDETDEERGGSTSGGRPSTRCCASWRPRPRASTRRWARP